MGIIQYIEGVLGLQGGGGCSVGGEEDLRMEFDCNRKRKARMENRLEGERGRDKRRRRREIRSDCDDEVSWSSWVLVR